MPRPRRRVDEGISLHRVLAVVICMVQPRGINVAGGMTIVAHCFQGVHHPEDPVAQTTTASPATFHQDTNTLGLIDWVSQVYYQSLILFSSSRLVSCCLLILVFFVGLSYTHGPAPRFAIVCKFGDENGSH